MTIRQTILTRPAETCRQTNGGPVSAWTSLGGSPRILIDDYYRNESVSTPGYSWQKRYLLPQHPHVRNRYVMRSDTTIAYIITTYTNGTVVTDYYRGNAMICDVNADIYASYYPELVSTNNLALSRLFEELSLTKGSAAVSLAEVGKTAEMIGDTARRLAKAYSSLRRGNLSAFAGALGITVSKRRAGAYRSRFRQQAKSESNSRQFAANTWLEYSYGWKPLINDVYTQAENLANYLTSRANVVRTARGSAKIKKQTDEVIGTPGYWLNPKRTKVTSRVKYVVRYKLTDGQGSLADTFGLKNPAIVAWELIPFSFVVDWFMPIGNFLEQLTATQGLTFHSATKSVTHESTSTCRVSAAPARIGAAKEVRIQGVTLGGNATQTKYEKSREVLMDFPLPRFPEFKNPLSISHATSGLALLQAVFHGGVKGYVSR